MSCTDCPKCAGCWKAKPTLAWHEAFQRKSRFRSSCHRHNKRAPRWRLSVDHFIGLFWQRDAPESQITNCNSIHIEGRQIEMKVARKPKRNQARRKRQVAQRNVD